MWKPNKQLTFTFQASSLHCSRWCVIISEALFVITSGLSSIVLSVTETSPEYLLNTKRSVKSRTIHLLLLAIFSWQLYLVYIYIYLYIYMYVYCMYTVCMYTVYCMYVYCMYTDHQSVQAEYTDSPSGPSSGRVSTFVLNKRTIGQSSYSYRSF